MAPRPTTEHLTELAEAIVADGFEPHRIALAAAVASARRAGICPVVTDIVADPAAPRPVRERALGRLVVALAAVADTTSDQVTTGAASAA